MSVLKAAESGTYRDLLVALRDLIARTIDDGCSPRDLVGLSRRLMDLAEDLRVMDAGIGPLRLVAAPDEPWNLDEPFGPEAV